MTKKIGIICGSLKQSSYNRIVAETIIKMNDTVDFQWIELKDLPLFNEDLEVGGDPEAVTTFKEAIRNVDGLLIVSPEYNSGTPGVLKNALDWSSRPARSSVIAKKPVGLVGATPGGMGTAFSQMQTRQTLEAVQAYVLPLQKMMISQVHEKVDVEQRTITDEKTITYLQRYVANFLSWTDRATNIM